MIAQQTPQSIARRTTHKDFINSIRDLKVFNIFFQNSETGAKSPLVYRTTSGVKPLRMNFEDAVDMFEFIYSIEKILEKELYGKEAVTKENFFAIIDFPLQTALREYERIMSKIFNGTPNEKSAALKHTLLTKFEWHTGDTTWKTRGISIESPDLEREAGILFMAIDADTTDPESLKAAENIAKWLLGVDRILTSDVIKTQRGIHIHIAFECTEKYSCEDMRAIIAHLLSTHGPSAKETKVEIVYNTIILGSKHYFESRENLTKLLNKNLFIVNAEDFVEKHKNFIYKTPSAQKRKLNYTKKYMKHRSRAVNPTTVTQEEITELFDSGIMFFRTNYADLFAIKDPVFREIYKNEKSEAVINKLRALARREETKISYGRDHKTKTEFKVARLKNESSYISFIYTSDRKQILGAYSEKYNYTYWHIHKNAYTASHNYAETLLAREKSFQLIQVAHFLYHTDIDEDTPMSAAQLIESFTRNRKVYSPIFMNRNYYRAIGIKLAEPYPFLESKTGITEKSIN